MAAVGVHPTRPSLVGEPVIAKLKSLPPPTLLTGIVVILWAITFVLRQIRPEWSAMGPAADAAVTTCIAWWMKTRASKTGGTDLLSTLVNEVAMPNMKPATPMPAPKPVPKTAPPTPPTKGGLPWD